MDTWKRWGNETVRMMAFEIRAEITPTHGYLQVLATGSEWEREAERLYGLLARLQIVEVVLRELIAGRIKRRPWIARQAVLLGEELGSVYRELLKLPLDPVSERLAVMLQGLWMAERLCRELADLAG